MASRTPTICLNMIVKNESRIIQRLLESVINLIDTYCICDTGSTDNTTEIIETFFSTHNKPGKIIREPFKDFGYNRTFALKAVYEHMPEIDYVLLMDADMVLTGNCLQDANIESFKQGLVCDHYHICQGDPKYYYKNVRIVRNNNLFSYWGVTHEYVNAPSNASIGVFDNETIFINDIGDGGAKGDKFERDISLLTKGLEDHPNNDRYTFYLANSLKDAGYYERAIETYRKRIEIGGWEQEVWYSHLNIGHCYMSLRQEEKAICAWLEGYEYYPRRLEGLYEIVKYYRERGKNSLAYWYYMMAKKSYETWGLSNDYLFLQKDIYDYKMDYEMTIIGYYKNDANINMNKLTMRVLNNPHVEDYIINNVMSNYKFYSEKLLDAKQYQHQHNMDILDTATHSLRDSIDKDCVASTPSFVFCDNQLIVNVRYVNYKIDENGNYVNKERIKTINAISVISTGVEWKIQSEFILEYDKGANNYYVGLEDVRLYTENGEIYYNANRGLSGHSMVIEHGKIDIVAASTKESIFLKKPVQRPIEKNWVMLPSASNTLSMVYEWFPNITIGQIKDGDFIETHSIASPPVFRNLRGSTNGILVNGEIWILCHIVSYEDRRYYYNMIVRLKKDTYEVVNYTPYFTFEGEKVEYALGFQYTECDDSFWIGYSIYDRETRYINITRNYFLSKMVI